MNARLLCCVLILVSATCVFGQRGQLTTAQQRRWLQQNVVNRQPTAIRQQFQGILANLSDAQVNSAYQHYLRLAQQQLAQLQALRNQLQRQAGGRPVGFAPVVTWLPEGATMNVGAVVSPDRRYVRINAQSFFSSIPRVDTFTFARPTSPFGFGGTPVSTPLFNQPVPVVGQAAPQQQAAPRVWHDGLRTRVGR